MVTLGTEIASAKASSADHVRRLAPFVIVMTVLICLDLVAATGMPDTGADLLSGIMLGAAFAQVVVSAVLISMMRFALVPRILSGTVLTGTATFSIFQWLMSDASSNIALTLVCVMVGMWIFYQIPLWIARASGWSIARIDSEPADARETQFGIRHLLIWTAMVGAFLGLMRLLVNNLVDTSTFSEISLTREDIDAGTILVSAGSVIMYPVIWGCFVKRWLWLWAIIAIAWGMIVSFVESNAGLPGSGDILVAINVMQIIAGVVVLFTLRIAGFRLHRRTSA